MCEYHFRWTCPGCGKSQNDSVNPELGPYCTCTCNDCCRSYSDDQLDDISAASWEAARVKAEKRA